MLLCSVALKCAVRCSKVVVSALYVTALLCPQQDMVAACRLVFTWDCFVWVHPSVVSSPTAHQSHIGWC